MKSIIRVPSIVQDNNLTKNNRSRRITGSFHFCDPKMFGGFEES